jgi:hypothetical protein
VIAPGSFVDFTNTIFVEFFHLQVVLGKRHCRLSLSPGLIASLDSVGKITRNRGEQDRLLVSWLTSLSFQESACGGYIQRSNVATIVTSALLGRGQRQQRLSSPTTSWDDETTLPPGRVRVPWEARWLLCARDPSQVWLQPRRTHVIMVCELLRTLPHA